MGQAGAAAEGGVSVAIYEWSAGLGGEVETKRNAECREKYDVYIYKYTYIYAYYIHSQM